MEHNQFTGRILAYLESTGKSKDEALLGEAGQRLTAAIQRQLMEDREDKPGTLRMSSGGQCIRKQWYAYKNEDREPLSGRTVNTFLTGDLLEVSTSILGRLAGWNLMGKPNGEDEISLEIAGTKITGHPDDMLHVPEENRYYVVEYKTMSEFSYRKFEKEGLDDTWGYLTQGSLYCEAMGIDAFILVGICKNTGHLCDRVIVKDAEAVTRAKEKWERILVDDSIPSRDFVPEPETKYNRSTKVYDPTGRSILGIQCSYCQFRSACWPEAVLEAGSKPIWIVPTEINPMSV